MQTKTMSEIFDVTKLQILQDAFAKKVGVASLMVHTDGLPVTQPSNFSRLCMHVIRKTAKGNANCMHSDSMIGRKNPGGPIVQPCMSGGLWDSGASICVNDQ